MAIGIKNTTAYRIVRQIIDHTRGHESKISDDDFLSIFENFYRKGGSWEKITSGSMHDVKLIEDSIDEFFNLAKLKKIAGVISGNVKCG